MIGRRTAAEGGTLFFPAFPAIISLSDSAHLPAPVASPRPDLVILLDAPAEVLEVELLRGEELAGLRPRAP